MLMTAGLGTRLRPFTDMEPKPLLPLMGIPIAQFGVDTLLGAGVNKIVANVHHLAPRAVAGLMALERGSAELIISDESALLLGSVGGLRKALPHFGSDPFFVLNADVVCDVDLEALSMAHQRLRAKWDVSVTLTVFPQGPQPGKYTEILIDDAGEKIRGLGSVQSQRPFFVGAAIVEPDALRHLPGDVPLEFLPHLLLPAIEEGRAGVYLPATQPQGLWLDVGSPELWLEAHLSLIDALERGKLPRAWRTRIENVNRRVGQRLWASGGTPSRLSVVEWAAPAYWSSDQNDSADSPRIFGPRSVLYGPASSKGHAGSGIGYRGVWVNF